MHTIIIKDIRKLAPKLKKRKKQLYHDFESELMDVVRKYKRKLK